MSVITISRGSFSGGKLLAECLSQRLGYRCIDRDVIIERAAAGGVSQNELMDTLLKPPGLLDRFRHRKYIYLTLIQAALAEEIRTGKVIYHGNAGHLLLRGAPQMLRVRIIAPLEFRLNMVQERLKLNRSEALAYIHSVDENRIRWTRYLYGVSWGDPALYDIVLNLEQIDVKEACEVVVTMATQKAFEFTTESLIAYEDVALASRVRANLAMNIATSDLEVEVTAHSGSVSIKGTLATLDQIEEVKRVARGTAGVTDLNLDELAPMPSV
ncbi:MAG: cytidylate kinase family protein [Candidatus Binataceae bacterium]